MHATAEEAVAHVLSELGDDYRDVFWASTDGKDLCWDPNRTLDFHVRIYPSVSIALAALTQLDLDSLPGALRVMADAIQAHTEA